MGTLAWVVRCVRGAAGGEGVGMNNNVADIKPWFREDHERTLMSIYFPFSQTYHSRDERFAFALAISSMALAFGINPEKFLSPEDVQLLRSSGRI